MEFWQYPTINALAQFLTGGEPEPAVESIGEPDRGSMDEPIAVIGLGCRFPGDIGGPESLWQFLCEGRSAVGEVPRIGGRGSMTAHRGGGGAGGHHPVGLVSERRGRL